MAASAVAQFPWIKTLSLTIDLDGHFRAADGAQRAADAPLVFLAHNGMVAFGVQLGCCDDPGLLAGLDAKVALLAELPVDHDAGFHRFFSLRVVAKRLSSCA
jgi:hypothetical protein